MCPWKIGIIALKRLSDRRSVPKSLARAAKNRESIAYISLFQNKFRTIFSLKYILKNTSF